MIEKIVSGGQTGADRAALDFALANGIAIGGWVPRGRLAEDGRIPERYPGLIETDSSDPAARTALNVRDSDATLILSHGPLSGGSLLTLDEAIRTGKPVLHLDLDELALPPAADRLRGWLATVRPGILNVAGPRASGDPEIAAATGAVLALALLDDGGSIMAHKGSCHCGQIKFEVQGNFDTAMECNCSHCSRKGYLLWFVPRSQFKLQSPESALSTYTFNKHVIKHHFCPKCGCAPFGFGESKGAQTAAINVRCLDGIELSTVKRQFFDGRAL